MAAVESPKYEELCRLCATKTTMVLAINIFENEGTIRQISKKICTCLPIQVHESDELPKMICENCLYKLELFCDFRERSARTEKLLVELYKELSSAHNDQQQTCLVSMDQNELIMVQHPQLLNDHNLHAVSQLDLSHLSQREGMIVEHEIILTQHNVDMNSHSLDSIDLNNHDLTNQDLSNQSLQTQDTLIVDSNTQSIQDPHFAEDNLNLIQQQQLSDEFRVQHDLHVGMSEEVSSDIQLTNEMKQLQGQDYNLQDKLENCNNITDIEVSDSKLQMNSYSRNNHVPLYSIYNAKDFKMESVKQEDGNSEYTLLVDEQLNNARVPNLVNEKQAYNLNVETTDSMKYLNKTKDCFYCNICGKSYEQKVEFEIHYETHFNKCSICFAVFTNLDVLNAHRKEAHGDCMDNQKLSTTNDTEIKQEEIILPFKYEEVYFDEEDFAYVINTNEELPESNTFEDMIDMEIAPNDIKKIRNTDYCLFCKIDVSNFARHIQRHHSSEKEVKKILCYPANNRTRKELLCALRKKGNYIKYLYNEKNIKHKKCKLPQSKLLPCNFCFGFYSNKGLWRHKRRCPEKKGSSFNKFVQNVITKQFKGNKQLRELVFPKMREDSISLQVKRDALICEFGNKCLTKRKNQDHDINVISRKMRELARLLIEIKILEPRVKTLFEALQPQYLDVIIQATKNVAKFNADKGTFISPTYVRCMSTSLKHCCDIALVSLTEGKEMYATENSTESESNLKKILDLLDDEWKKIMSKRATNDLKIIKENKYTIISLAHDVKLLNEYLTVTATDAAFKLSIDENDVESYTRLLETVYCRIIILNKEIPREFHNMLISTYVDSSKNSQDISIITSPAENILIKKFNYIILKDEQERMVPIFFNSNVQTHIKLLIDKRSNFFDAKNQSLFLKPNKNNAVCGKKSLETHVMLSGIKNAAVLIDSSLTKHVALIVQTLSMTQSDIDELAGYMGKSLSPGKNTYNVPDDVHQSAVITQMILLMERQPFICKTKSKEELNLILREEQEVALIEDIKVKELLNVEAKREVTTKKRIHVPWTREQKEIVYKFFKYHVKHKKPPKKRECDELIEKYPIQFKNRSWVKIKVFVQNAYTKT